MNLANCDILPTYSYYYRACKGIRPDSRSATPTYTIIKSALHVAGENVYFEVFQVGQAR